MKNFLVGLVISYGILLTSISFPRSKQPIQYRPWRGPYQEKTNIRLRNQESNSEESKNQCIFCKLPEESKDEENHILYRNTYTYVTFPTNPYTDNGYHLLVMPYTHEKELSALDKKTCEELDSVARKLCEYLSSESREIYIGLNLGKNSAASIPDHLHVHIVFDKNEKTYSLIQAMKQTSKILDLSAAYKNFKQRFPTLEIDKTKNQAITVNNKNSNSSCDVCTRIGANNDRDNLIIYRGKNIALLFENCPKVVGHLNIVPLKHIEKLEDMPEKTYKEMNKFTRKYYPLLLKTLNIKDIQISMMPSSDKTETKEHIRQHLIPCSGTHLGGYTRLAKMGLSFDAEKLYIKLVDATKEIIEKKNSYKKGSCS